MSVVARLRRSSSLRSFRHAAFARMAAANAVSVTGTWMQTIAQSWVVFELTGSTTALGGSVAVQAAPPVLLGLWGGAVVDRLDKRRVLVVTQVVLALVAAVLAVVASSPMLTVGTLYVLGLLTGVVHVFDGPANATFGTELVPRDDLANAAAIGSAINSAGRIVGMGLGGVLVAAAGPSSVFWCNALSYLAVVLVLLTMPTGEVTQLARSSADRAGIRHGLGHLREHPGLVVVIVLSFFLSSFGRNFQVTMAAMTGQVFELDAAAYGRASTAFAVGALAGAILATRLRRPGISALLVFAAVAAGLQVLAGLAPGMRTFSTVILAVGAAAVVVDTVLSTHVQLTVAEAFRGRALAVVGLVGMAGSAVGAPLLGFLADVIGARGALLTGGAVAAAATGLAWMLLVDRTSTPAGGPPPRPRPTMGLAVGRSRLATPTGT